MSEDFDVNRWLYRTGKQVHRSGTAAGANLFDEFIRRRRSSGRRHRRLWPWALGSLVWFMLPLWIELALTVLCVGAAAMIWVTVNESRTSDRS